MQLYFSKSKNLLLYIPRKIYFAKMIINCHTQGFFHHIMSNYMSIEVFHNFMGWRRQVSLNLTRFHSSNSFLKVNFFKNTQEKAHTLFPSSLIMNISISFKAFQFSLITRIIIAGTSNQKHFFFFRYITDDCFFDNICI